jgi:3'-phosphoadenosine 5'-phosphosulfate sulfotransferase (PAPS reductase)/FAD synthetase
MSEQYWLCYGGGVNSTALAILLVQEKLPQYKPWLPIFGDTGNEKQETYWFVSVFEKWLCDRGKDLIKVSGPMTVLEKWQHDKITGSTRTRSCTDHAKTRPIDRYIKEHGGGIKLIAFDAGEPNRAKPNPKHRYPLIDLGIDRNDCIGIIREAGLPVPVKSGCWHCPFLRVADIIELGRSQPRKLDIIEKLESEALKHRGKPYYQWGNKPVAYWRSRAKANTIFSTDYDICMPCECYDG